MLSFVLVAGLSTCSALRFNEVQTLVNQNYEGSLEDVEGRRRRRRRRRKTDSDTGTTDTTGTDTSGTSNIEAAVGSFNSANAELVVDFSFTGTNTAVDATATGLTKFKAALVTALSPVVLIALNTLGGSTETLAGIKVLLTANLKVSPFAFSKHHILVSFPEAAGWKQSATSKITADDYDAVFKTQQYRESAAKALTDAAAADSFSDYNVLRILAVTEKSVSRSSFEGALTLKALLVNPVAGTRPEASKLGFRFDKDNSVALLLSRKITHSLQTTLNLASGRSYVQIENIDRMVNMKKKEYEWTLKFAYTDDLFTDNGLTLKARKDSRILYVKHMTEPDWSKRFRKTMEDAIQKESGLPTDGSKGIIHVTNILTADSDCATVPTGGTQATRCLAAHKETTVVTWQYEGYSSTDSTGPNPGSIIHDFSAHLSRNDNHDAMQARVMALFKTWTPTKTECVEMAKGAVTEAQCMSPIKFDVAATNKAIKTNNDATDCGQEGDPFAYEETGRNDGKTLHVKVDCDATEFSTDANTVQTFRVTYRIHMQNSEYENVEETIKAIQTTTNWGSPGFGPKAMADLRADGTVKAMGIVLTSITSDPYSLLHLQHHD